MKHPYSAQVTTESALNLARALKYGPLPSPKAPTPTVDEAIIILKQELKICGFNWITGQRAVEVLRLTRGDLEVL